MLEFQKIGVDPAWVCRSEFARNVRNKQRFVPASIINQKRYSYRSGYSTVGVLRSTDLLALSAQLRKTDILRSWSDRVIRVQPNEDKFGLVSQKNGGGVRFWADDHIRTIKDNQ